LVGNFPQEGVANLRPPTPSIVPPLPYFTTLFSPLCHCRSRRRREGRKEIAAGRKDKRRNGSVEKEEEKVEEK